MCTRGSFREIYTGSGQISPGLCLIAVEFVGVSVDQLSSSREVCVCERYACVCILCVCVKVVWSCVSDTVVEGMCVCVSVSVCVCVCTYEGERHVRRQMHFQTSTCVFELCVHNVGTLAVYTVESHVHWSECCHCLSHMTPN